MSANERNLATPWLWVTLTFGCLSLLNAPLYELDTVGSKSTAVSSNSSTSNEVRSDILFPTPEDTISKNLGPWDDPFGPVEDKLDFSSEPQPPMALDVIRSKLGKDDGNASLCVIIKIVNGKATDEGKETRRRQRLALESALNWAGYSMSYPGRMTYSEAQLSFYHTPTVSTQHTVDVPLKLYTKTVEENDVFKRRLVLIAWIRDEHLGELPLNTIAQLTKSVLRKTDSPQAGIDKLIGETHLLVAGPSYSDTLSKMAKEFSYAKSSSIAETKDNLQLLAKFKCAMLLNSNCTASNAGIGISKDKIPLTDEKSIEIAQIIGEDTLLVQSLRDELALRGRTDPGNNTVLFVEEQSYQYIRELREKLLGKAANITVIPYLPGIATKETGNSSTSDYLTRTFADLHNDKSESVAAVGVFGSRTTDKIAIFKAARNIFPTAAYFTTEIDADYIDPNNYIACRNLLIASHFGLTVNTQLFNEMQRKAPIFRDGYQTSSFAGLLVGLKHFESEGKTPQEGIVKNLWLRAINESFFNGKLGQWRSKLSEESLQPLVFEVSRSGFHQFKTAATDSILSSSRDISHPNSATTLFARGGRILNIALCLFVVWSILMLFRVHSNGIRNMLEQSKKLMLAVIYFVVFQVARLFMAIKRSTDPAENDGRLLAVDGSNLPAPMLLGESQDAIDKRNKNDEPIWFVSWFLMVCSVSIALLVIAWISDLDVNGEPVSLLNAISIWPSVLLFHVVSCVSSYIVARSMSRDWKQAWSGFLLAIALVCLIWTTLGSVWRDIPPARGELPRMVAYLSLIAAACWLFYLASLSSLNILRSRKSISDKLDQLNDDFDGRLGVSSTLDMQAGNLLKKSAEFRESLSEAMMLGEKASVALIAPAALTIVLAMARLPLLDSWGLPRVWYAALMTPLLLSVVAALLMRGEARRLKTETLEKFESSLSKIHCQFADQSLALSSSSAGAALDEQVVKPNREQFNDFLSKVSANLELIRGLRRGPFGSVYSDPLLGGILLILTAAATGPLRETTISLLNYLPGIAS